MHYYEELCHYGIKGMRWGIHRSITGSQEKLENNKKNINDMSDEELKAATQRLRLENEYKSYTQKKGFVDNAIKPAINEAGKKIIKEFLIKQGKKILKLDNKIDEKVTHTNLKKRYEPLTREQNKDRRKKAEEFMKERFSQQAGSGTTNSLGRFLLEDMHVG